jgi:hypothetical protein
MTKETKSQPIAKMKILQPRFERLFLGLLKWAGILLLIWSALFFLNLHYTKGSFKMCNYLLFVILPCSSLFIFSVLSSWMLFCPKIKYDTKQISINIIFRKTQSHTWSKLIYYKSDYMGFLLEFLPNCKFQVVDIAYSKKSWETFLEFLNLTMPDKRIYPNEFPGGGL